MTWNKGSQLIYEGWRSRKRKVLKYLLSYQIIVLLLGVTALSWNFASVIIPLCLFSVAVLAYVTYRYARDGDWEVIHIVFGANLRDVIGLMRSPEFASRYELTEQDSRRLAILAAKPEVIEFAQELFAGHRIFNDEPSARSKRLADIALLLLGAIIGAFAQRRLAPPAGVRPEIWHISITKLIEQEPYVVTILTLITASAIFLNFLGKRRTEAERRMLIRYARERPISLFSEILPSTIEVRRKIRDAVQWAARISTEDMTSVMALEKITGVKITKDDQRRTALGEIQWTIFLFDMGIVLGAALPPLLGIG